MPNIRLYSLIALSNLKGFIMEIGKRIKELRGSKGWNQEEFAEKVFVSRQTVSSWENGKSYPDIKSLLLMSELFGITLDEFVKGDLVTMKKEINKDAVSRFNRLSYIYVIGFLIALVTPYPLFFYLGWAGFVIWILYMIPLIIFAFYIEKLKKTNDIATYKEIVAFCEGKELDRDAKIAEKAKRPYQSVLLAIGAAALLLAILLLEKLIIK